MISGCETMTCTGNRGVFIDDTFKCCAKIFCQMYNIHGLCFVCLFDLILYVPSTIFQLNRDGSSWVEPVLSYDKCVLLKDHNAVMQVRLEPVAPQSGVKHSITEPLRFPHGLCNGHYVPLVFILLPEKSESIYRSMWIAITSLFERSKTL